MTKRKDEITEDDVAAADTAATEPTDDTKADAIGDGDLGQTEVQDRVADEQAQGYVGTVPDPTPNENYTLAGVTSGAPTPETDAEAADAAREARREVDGIGTAPADRVPDGE